MKKVLLGTTALLLSAGVAAADVAVSGDGRMGVIDDFGDNSDAGFTSRIRIAFSASGETDGGLSFGGSVRVDNYENDQATKGTEGSVFVEGAFGKISMGDVSGAPEAAAGDLSGVGLTGLGDANELTYLSNGDRPAMRYDYVMGSLGFHLSADNPENDDSAADDDNSTYGVAVTYSAGALSAGLGYESTELTFDGVADEFLGVVVPAGTLDADHIVGSLAYAFGDASVKAAYGMADIGDDAEFTQMGLSVDYVIGATTVTAYYINRELEAGGATAADIDAMGLGVAYDLGGGASLKAGYANVDADGVEDEDAFDFGISMSF